MEKLLAAPNVLGILGLLFSGAFFKFVFDILKWTGKNRTRRESQWRLYEVAYRLSNAHAKTVTQYAITVAAAHKAADADDEHALLTPYLGIMCRALGAVDAEGKWRPHPYPDFLYLSRKELKLLDDEEKEEPEPPAKEGEG